MSVVVEALYIFDEQGNCVLEHTFTARPPPAKDLITRLKAISSPRPSIVQLTDLSPSTTVYSISHGNLLLASTSSKDAQSLAILEFLYRVVDVFEDFLGSPLLSGKIEENYEIVAQLLGEMCDAGVVCNTEPNALKEQVEISTLIGKLFTQVGIPGPSPALGPSSNLAATLKANSVAANGPAIPWRKPNVRHTSNELYVDIVENLSVVFAPSGRPISARAAGSIAFTAKISGVPELLLNLTAPGGTSSAKASDLARTMQLPVFHPCVRLSRWKDHPGELSFVPPDGRFVLAGYESDLLPSSINTDEPPSRATDRIFLPCTVDLRTALGQQSSDFEARLTLSTAFPGISASKPNPASRSTSGTTPFSFGSAGSGSGSSGAPTLEAVVVTIPFPSDVRSVVELKPSRGEASFNMANKTVEWKVPTKDGGSIGGVAVLTGTVIGPLSTSFGEEEELEATAEAQAKAGTMAGYYDDEDVIGGSDRHQVLSKTTSQNGSTAAARKTQANRALMPRSIAVSFAVKGWLASEIKVESLVVDVKRSKGLGDGIKPYKGVKYLTVSRMGVERRVE